MASLQEINAKRKELMGTGQFANEKEAAVAARNQLTPTPVTPSPTLTTNQAQLAENQAKRQEMIQSGSVPAPATSPTTPTPTQVTTPSTPAPVETPAPVAPVTPAPVDKSAEIKAKNEAQMGINQQKAQLAEQARQKGIDEQNAALANSEGAILNTLKTGGIIPESVKTSTYYKSAQQTYNQLQRYSTYSTNELVTAMNQGSIVPGTSVFNEMMKDPVMKQKISDAQIYRAATPVNTVQVYEEASSNILADNPNTANYLSDGVITLDEYNQATNNTSVMAKAQEVEEKANKYNTIKAEYDSIEDEVKAQFPASPFADSIIADRQKAKYKNLVLAKGEWETATGTLTELKSQAANLFETNLGLYQEQKKTSEAYKMANYQAQLGLQTKGAEMQMESDFAKKKAAEALNDPQTAITNMMEEYKKLGIPFSESIQTKVATAEDFIAKGGTLAGYLDKMQKDIQAKPEFQRYQALQQGQLSDREKFQMQTAVEDRRDMRNFAQQKELAIFNKNIEQEQFLFELENDPEKKAKVLALEAQLQSNKSLFDVLGKNVGTYEGNRGYDLAGNLGDPLPAGGNWTVKSIDTAGEQVGSIFIGGKGQKPYGNTVVMEDENGNEIRYSHLQNIGVKPGDVLGFGDIVGTRGNTGNVRGANGETLTAEQLKAGRGAHLDVEIKSNGKLLSNSDQVAFLKGLKAGGTGISGASLPLYRAYMEDNKLPSKDALSGLGMTSEQFVNNASTGYDKFLRSKEQEINATYPTLQVEYTPSYASISATQREKLNESMTKIGDIDMRLEKLKKLFNENGTEVLPTNAKKEMQSLKQQIILKAKEVENLGVLNGPDLGILESLIPETTGLMSGLFSFDDNTKTTLDSIQNNYRSDAQTKGINYGAKIRFKGIGESKTNNSSAPQTYQGYSIKPF